MRIQYPGFGRLLALIFLLNILAAQLLHEAGHWAVMQAFGRRPLWGITSLVQLSEQTPSTPADWVEFTNLDGSISWLHLNSLPASNAEWLLFLAAGPVIQLAAVVVGLLLAKYGRNPTVRMIGFLIGVVNAFGGFFYQLVSLLSGGGGDETLIGHYLTISPVVISAVIGIGFAIGFLIAMWTLETWKIRLKTIGILILGTLPIGPLLMISNRIIIEQVDAGNPLFRSVLGFSLPVFLTALICFILLGVAIKRWDFFPSAS